jgi:hypothetical protein
MSGGLEQSVGNCALPWFCDVMLLHAQLPRYEREAGAARAVELRGRLQHEPEGVFGHPPDPNYFGASLSLALLSDAATRSKLGISAEEALSVRAASTRARSGRGGCLLARRGPG